MIEKYIIKIERTVFKFLWNKKAQGKCPDRIKRQPLKYSYKKVTLTEPDKTFKIDIL
jgi:hypothetical protein